MRPTFTTVARTLALFWILGVVVPSVWRKERVHDFAQVYMGAKVVSAGEAAHLYPLPHPGAHRNAGFAGASAMQPAYERLAQEEDLGGYNRFVYPPPAVLPLLALVPLGYERALRVWSILMGLAGWMVACQAGWIAADLAGRATRLAGIVTLLVAGSPLLAYALRSGNVSPLVAACIGTSIIGLRAHSGTRTDFEVALGCALGGLFKGTSVSLLPLVLAMGRLRSLLYLAGLTLLAVLGTWLLVGREPFRVFFEEIAPTFARSDAAHANQSLSASLLRYRGALELSQVWVIALRVVGTSALLGLGAWVFVRREALRRSPVMFYAAVAGLLVVPLIFAPLAWVHYQLLGALLFGWLAREARGSRGRALLALLPVASAIFPAALFVELPEPIGSHFLLGNLAILTLATWRLGAREEPKKLNGVAR